MSTKRRVYASAATATTATNAPADGWQGGGTPLTPMTPFPIAPTPFPVGSVGEPARPSMEAPPSSVGTTPAITPQDFPPSYPQQGLPPQSQYPNESRPPAGSLLNGLEQYQCPKDFMRTTISQAPASPAVLQKLALPFGCVIHPLNPLQGIPLIDFGAIGVIRCRRCRSYINPFVTFLDGGRRWKCNLCGLIHEVPAEYYSPLDESGKRRDIEERAELTNGAVEFVAPTEYMVRPPQPPVYLFVIDVSLGAVANGQVQITADTILRTLDGLPGDQQTRVGFVTFDSKVHLYHIQAGSGRPQMMVLPVGTEKLVIPSGYQFLVHLKDCKAAIVNLLTNLPKMFEHNQDNRSCLGTALTAAFHIGKPIGGKLLAFTSSFPSVGLGVMSNRFDPKLLNTPKEIYLIKPSTEFYKKFGLKCSKHQIGVDLFSFSRDGLFLDVANIGQLSELSGGQLHFYPNFTNGVNTLDGHKFAMDLFNDLTRETGFEAVMRVRCSQGVNVVHHYGNFFLRSTDLLALPNVDSSKAFGVTLQVAEDLANTVGQVGPYVTIQAALLYTTSNSERRIRVLTTALPLTSDLQLLYRGADVKTIANLLTKMSLHKSLTSSIDESREALINKLADTISAFKSNFQSQQGHHQQLLPDSLKHLPLYTLAASKSVLFRGFGNVPPDVRSFYFQTFRTMPVEVGCTFLYPRLFALHNLDGQAGLISEETGIVSLPPILSLSSEKLSRNGIFLMDNGLSLFMRICVDVDPNILIELFGTKDLPQIHLHQASIQPNPELPPDSITNRIGNIIAFLQSDIERVFFPRLYIFKEKEAFDVNNFMASMIEDKYGGCHSYNEFMILLQRQIFKK